MDDENPSSLSLIYRGRIEDGGIVDIGIMAEFPAVIIPNELQWGYKLYGPEYALVDEPSIGCLM